MSTNEFGIRLDGNGYAPSILEPTAPRCALCGRSFGAKLDRHEPFGAANREKSKALGLWVSLCHWGCHEGPGSVHGGNTAAARELRRQAQAQAMCVYGWDLDEWRRRFGKSEIGEGEDIWKVSACGPTPLFSSAKKAGGKAPVTGDFPAMVPLDNPPRAAPWRTPGEGHGGFQRLDNVPDLPY